MGRIPDGCRSCEATNGLGRIAARFITWPRPAVSSCIPEHSHPYAESPSAVVIVKPPQRLNGSPARLAGIVLLAVGVLATPGPGPANGATSSLCGHSATGTPPAISHVLIVMMENDSYRQIVGSANAPYQTSLAAQCGSATAMFGLTHSSAANYLGVSAGEYPARSPSGCGTVNGCQDGSNNLYHQLDTAGLTWRAYEESMPDPCDHNTGGKYKIGHNPALFYTDLPAAECASDDLPVADLTVPTGVFWDALSSQTLPSLSWVTPNLNDDGEGPGGLASADRAADAWLQSFMDLMSGSASYQAGNTLVLIAYDEGNGQDYKIGEDCTAENLDLPVTDGISAHQDSCHLPLFVVDPYTPAGRHDATFFDLYSLTRTVEDIFGLPHLAHAADSQTASLIEHFGLDA